MHYYYSTLYYLFRSREISLDVVSIGPGIVILRTKFKAVSYKQFTILQTSDKCYRVIWYEYSNLVHRIVRSNYCSFRSLTEIANFINITINN